MTPSGNEPATFRLVAQCLNRLRHCVLHNWITSIILQGNSLEHSHSSEADSFSANQEIPHILQNPQIHCRLHYNPQFVPTPRQIYPFQTLPYYSLKINFNILPSPPRFRKWSLSFRFPHDHYFTYYIRWTGLYAAFLVLLLSFDISSSWVISLKLKGWHTQLRSLLLN